MNALTVCVGQAYTDLLAITLPRNARHFEKTLVVTSLTDVRTVALVESMPDFPRRIQYFKTDAFTRYGATLNKGLALEESFDVLGRKGWMCVWDADVIVPRLMSWPLRPNKEVLYSAPRRILHDPKQWHPGLDWNTVPIVPESRPTTFPGYFHLFHADAQALKEPGLPWYDVTFSHAGGGDGFFQSRWPKDRKALMPVPLLHLGPRDTNWFGLSEEGLAENVRYRCARGWVRGVPADPTYQERVAVPGYEAREWVHAPGE